MYQSEIKGNSFYLDEASITHALKTELVQKIKLLKGRVEEFFNKSVNCLITKNAAALDNSAVPLPLGSPQQPSPQSPLVRTPLSANTGTPPTDDGGSGRQSLSRASAMVAKARQGKSTPVGGNDLITKAHQWNIKIWHVDKAVLYLNTNINMQKMRGFKHKTKKKKTISKPTGRKCLKTPYIKIEVLRDAGKYKPVYRQFPGGQIPVLNLHQHYTHNKPAQLIKTQHLHCKEKENEQPNVINKDINNPLQREKLNAQNNPLAVKQHETKSRRKTGGLGDYCYMCETPFEDLDQHEDSEMHCKHMETDTYKRLINISKEMMYLFLFGDSPPPDLPDDPRNIFQYLADKEKALKYNQDQSVHSTDDDNVPEQENVLCDSERGKLDDSIFATISESKVVVKPLKLEDMQAVLGEKVELEECGDVGVMHTLNQDMNEEQIVGEANEKNKSNWINKKAEKKIGFTGNFMADLQNIAGGHAYKPLINNFGWCANTNIVDDDPQQSDDDLLFNTLDNFIKKKVALTRQKNSGLLTTQSDAIYNTPNQSLNQSNQPCLCNILPALPVKKKIHPAEEQEEKSPPASMARLSVALLSDDDPSVKPEPLPVHTDTPTFQLPVHTDTPTFQLPVESTTPLQPAVKSGTALQIPVQAGVPSTQLSAPMNTPLSHQISKNSSTTKHNHHTSQQISPISEDGQIAQPKPVHDNKQSAKPKIFRPFDNSSPQTQSPAMSVKSGTPLPVPNELTDAGTPLQLQTGISPVHNPNYSRQPRNGSETVEMSDQKGGSDDSIDVSSINSSSVDRANEVRRTFKIMQRKQHTKYSISPDWIEDRLTKGRTEDQTSPFAISKHPVKSSERKSVESQPKTPEKQPPTRSKRHRKQREMEGTVPSDLVDIVTEYNDMPSDGILPDDMLPTAPVNLESDISDNGYPVEHSESSVYSVVNTTPTRIKIIKLKTSEQTSDIEPNGFSYDAEPITSTVRKHPSTPTHNNVNNRNAKRKLSNKSAKSVESKRKLDNNTMISNDVNPMNTAESTFTERTKHSTHKKKQNRKQKRRSISHQETSREQQPATDQETSREQQPATDQDTVVTENDCETQYGEEIASPIIRKLKRKHKFSASSSRIKPIMLNQSLDSTYNKTQHQMDTTDSMSHWTRDYMETNNSLMSSESQTDWETSKVSLVENNTSLAVVRPPPLTAAITTSLYKEKYSLFGF